MRRFSWILAWPYHAQLLICLVCIEAVGPTTAQDEVNNSTRERSRSLTQDNYTDEYLIGYGNDPFGDRAISHGQRRRKRSVAHLYNMVNCATGCDPLSYKGYGCYCGFLGSGYVVDGIDRCCQMHDWCYDSSGCPMFLEYFVPYHWKCYHRQPLCGVEPRSHGSCGERLCHCDQLLAQCLRKYPCPASKAICTSSPWRLLQNVFML